MSQEYQLLATPKPFVKWAGGKRQLLQTLEKDFPSKFRNFFEPFLGGGAVLFNILSKKPLIPCTVADLNSDLILTYATIRDNPYELISSLEKHHKNYFNNKESYYYQIRSSRPRTKIEKSSRLLFLNKTCFNGLYRVNKKGQFNVPLGRYSNPNIINKENILSVSKTLRSSKIKIICRDFQSVLDEAKKNDFVYFDPPYQPVSSTANFTSYTNKNFSISDLQRLSDTCEKLNSNGCHVMISNSNSKEVIKNFSSKTWKIKKISANRFINSNSSKRQGHSELIITNY